MYIIQFGSYILPDQYEMFESQGITKRIETAELAGLGGSFRLGGAATSPPEEDTITKRFIVVSDTDDNLETALDALVNELMLSQADFRQGQQLLIGLLPDGTYRCTIAECKEVRWSQEYFHFDNGWLGPVDITWQRSAPRWWTFEDGAWLGDHWDFADLETGGDLDSTTWGQTVVEQALSSSSTTFTITNSGKQRIVDGIIEFNGQITNPTILNNRNEHTFTWTGSLAGTDGDGDRLTVNIGNFDAKKNGGRGEFANLTIGTARGQLLPMVLEPGDNEIVITATSPNCTFRFYYAKTWL